MAKSDYSKIAKLLAVIGSVLAIIGIVMSFTADALAIVMNILGILCSIVIFMQVGLIKKKIKLKFVWWQLLIVVCVQAILMSYGGSFGELGIAGVVLEAIACILLIIKQL